MKKISILIFLILLFTLISPKTFAQEINGSSIKKQDVISSYQLAYPGILPDHPFYKLKVLRDKLIPLFIGNPQNKVDFYLLQADKGIAATSMLVQKGKIELSKETGLKAENNYTIITHIVKSNKWSIDEKKYNKLYSAAKKHQDVLRSIISSVPKQDQKIFQTIFYFSEQNEKEIRNTQRTLIK